MKLAWPLIQGATRITQAFGENPAVYARWGLPGHEGIDWGAPTGTPVLACADGEVYRAETNPDSGNYGMHVRISHRGGYKTVYAHLLRVLCKVGDRVRVGDVIGLVGDTGNSTGPHLHLTVKKPGSTAWPYEIVDPTRLLPFYVGEVDLLPYLRGDGRLYELQSRIDGHDTTETLQTQAGPGPVFFQVKNDSWEMLYADERWIYRAWDTSEGGGRYYGQFTGELLGAVWFKRYAHVGETVTRRPLIKHYEPDGRLRAAVTVVSDLRLLIVEDEHEFPSGIVLPDVATLGWIVNGQIEERYYYSTGLRSWLGRGRGESWVCELHDPGRPDLKRRDLGLPLGPLYFAPADVEPAAALAPMTLAPGVDYLNVRAEPDVRAARGGQIYPGSWFAPEERRVVGADVWWRWGGWWLAERYAGRTYLVRR